MLLAGGQGSRLYALTQKLAKPAVPFGGKYRIIDFPLSNCINSGIDTVGILTQYQPLVLNTSEMDNHGILTVCMEVYMYFRHIRKHLVPTGTKVRRMQFTRILHLLNDTIRNMSSFYPVTRSANRITVIFWSSISRKVLNSAWLLWKYRGRKLLVLA